MPVLAMTDGGTGHPETTSHRHRHEHRLLLADDPGASYGNVAATGIGVLHGVGLETPTQIAIFVSVTAAVGTGSGLTILAAWILGLVLANTLIALAAASGLLTRRRSISLALTAVVGVLSVAMGLLLTLGLDELIPAI